MAQASINERCIVGLPQCGYAFQSSRQAFIALPAEDESKLELQIIQDLLSEKNYNHYVALERFAPGQNAFCAKICSQIIVSQFCIAILNPSRHKKQKNVLMPNPNVHMEYGLMLGFHKYVIPFQREEEQLAFNISPLDTIKYTSTNFKKKANDAIDQAILTVGVPAGTPKQITSQRLFEYLAVRGLRVTRIVPNETTELLYKMGEPLGFNLLDGKEIVYLGMFEKEEPKEVIFRAKLLAQQLHSAKLEIGSKSPQHTPELAKEAQAIEDRLAIEIIVAADCNIAQLNSKFSELTQGLWKAPIVFRTMQEIDQVVQRERDAIGDL